jgi:hypothetical protein
MAHTPNRHVEAYDANVEAAENNIGRGNYDVAQIFATLALAAATMASGSASHA